MNAVVSEATKSEELSDPQATGPGERLKHARIANDLDLSRMADRLHLTSDMVEAIECDDYSELPARVFVRGYVRNYARAVGLSTDAICAQFDGLWPEEEGAKVQVHKAPSLPTDSRPANNWAGAVTWLLIVIMVVLFLMWWQGYLGRFTQGLESRDSTAIEQVSSDGILTAPKSTTPAVTAPQPVTGSGTLALPDKQNAAPVQGSPDTKPTPPAAAASASGAPAPAASSAPMTTPTAVSEPTPAASKSPAPAAAQAAVQLTFSAKCWVDVRDSSGDFRLVGIMQKGAQKQLGGKPPYRMVIGKASAVSISVDGKPFDLGPYTKDNVAHLTLSP